MTCSYHGLWRRCLAAFLLAILVSAAAFADGNETLGIPSIPIAAGSGYVAKGTGLSLGQPGTITITVPAGAVVKQVLLYWEGQHTSPSGDNAIIAGGIGVTGTLVGGPDHFFGTPLVYSSTYRADITSLNLIAPGTNNVQVSGMDFNHVNNGAGILVIIDDGTVNSDIQLRDGNDLAYRLFPEPRASTVPQTFTFTPALVARQANLSMFFSSVQGVASSGGTQRPNRISVTVGGVTTNYDDVLSSLDGEEWDTYRQMVTIPAGVGEMTVQAISGPGGDDDPNTPIPRPASFAWIAAGLSVPCTGLIGDFVWLDADCDGIQEAGEAGIAGVRINLYNAADELIATTVTDANGAYLFTGLCAGSYSVQVDGATLPAGVTPTSCANTPGVGDNSNCSPSPVALATDASEDRTIDFGYCIVCSGKIGDFIWKDLDCDGLQETAEPGIPNVTVNLLNSAGSIIATTVTDAHGFYLFTGLCAGGYAVQVDATTLPAGYTPTACNNAPGIADNSNCSPAPVVLTANNSEDLTIDFGYCEVCRGKIGNFIWKDKDCDGIQEYGEPGIFNVRVRLLNEAGQVIATTVTDCNGYYYFRNLCPGAYTVEVDTASLPDGFAPTVCNNAPGIGNNSNCSPAPVALATGTTEDRTIDFGYCQSVCYAKIGNFVWLDRDCDGIQDYGEPGIRNVTVRLLNASGAVVRSTVTDCSGYYLFCNLCPGEYTVQVVTSTLPAGYTPTTCSNDPGVGNNSNCNPSPVILATGTTQDRTIDFGYCEQPGGQGCTPGYWKQCQHFDSWPSPYRPTTLFSAVFDNAFPGKTLLQVLNLGGGGLNALGRHTVAALLNARSGGVDYDMTTAQVISAFNNAFPGSGTDYETLKDIFEDYNEQACPLHREATGATELPTAARMHQNYPNPFNPSTEITFELAEASFVRIRVFNLLGQEVKTLAEGQFEAGAHILSWDATDGAGAAVTSGVYFCQLQTGNTAQIIKMSLMR